MAETVTDGNLSPGTGQIDAPLPMDLSKELAQRITATGCDDIPKIAVENAKVAIVDTLGVLLAGSQEAATALVRRVLGPYTNKGKSVVLGTDVRATCLDAALINGTASHALDFDDMSDAMGGHPSAPVLSALLALADELGANGRALLHAYIVGFETEIKIARGVNFHHYKKGWHPTSTLGVFGAAAACACLLSLDEREIATALSLSVSLSSGVKANFGTMTKPLHVGHCARSGLLAALLANEGFTASSDAFEHTQGFLNVFNGPGTFNVNRILESWADPLEIVTPGAAIKRYPCCASTHPAIDAMLEIVRSHQPQSNAVCKIDAWIHARRLEHTNRPNPQTATEAKFSLQYCVALALLHGKVTLSDFEDKFFPDPSALELLRNIHVAAYPDNQIGTANDYGAVVTVTMTDGNIYSVKLDSALDQSTNSQVARDILRTKFEDCAGKALSPERVETLYETVQELEELSDIRRLTEIMAVTCPLRNVRT